MKTLNLILLSGKARSGKTTFANALISGGEWYEPLALADPIKTDLYLLDPILDHTGARLQDALSELGEDGTKEKYPEYRRLMQAYGTEVRRGWDDDVWIKQAIERLECMIDNIGINDSLNVVIPDVREMREGEGIISRVYHDLKCVTGLKAKISWFAIDRHNAGETGNAASHSSEVGIEGIMLDPRVVVLFNDGTEDELRAMAELVAGYQINTITV